MTAWRVRAAAAGDGELIAALEAQAFGAASWGADSVREGLAAPAVFGLVAETENGAPAAFALWRLLGRDSEILTIGVVPAMRRRGAGDALLSAIFVDAAAAGCAQMFLEVDAANAAARALYEKHGFEIVGGRRAYYRDGADALVFRRLF